MNLHALRAARTPVAALVVIAIAGVTSLAIFGGMSPTQTPPPPRPSTPPAAQDQKAPTAPGNSGLGDIGGKLIAGLEATEGCLGVDAGGMRSGKQVIFAWFENKAAVKRWYYSDLHQQLMAKFFPVPPAGDAHEPMADVPNDVPLLVIASLTPATEAQMKDTKLPVSQIAIESYTPVPGGIALGGRFAPNSFKVPGLQDITPTPAH